MRYRKPVTNTEPRIILGAPQRQETPEQERERISREPAAIP